MKIKNNTPANLSVSSKLTRGKTLKNFLTVPGEATLELEDSVWKAEYEESAAKQIKAGNLTVVEEAEWTEEELEAKEAAEVEAAEKLLAKKAKTTKATK